MPNLNKFQKIPQFRNVVKHVQKWSDYNGKPFPTLNFEGTVKLHGTNAAIGYAGRNFNGSLDKTGEMWCQSRSRIITPTDDNAGFAKFFYELDEDLKYMILHLLIRGLGDDLDLSHSEIIVYGEWCGEGIQKGVAISELEKFFVIFSIKINGKLYPCQELNEELYEKFNTYRIFFITQFPKYTISIDFGHPEASAEKMMSIVNEEIEPECPVGKFFGVSGIGEGIVWMTDEKSTEMLGGEPSLFKVKGERHSVTKVNSSMKKMVPIDPEKVESVKEFVDYSVTENRLQQGLNEIGLNQKTVGTFIGWVNRDISTEEGDVLVKNGLTMREVGRMVSNKARAWYLDQLNSNFDEQA